MAIQPSQPGTSQPLSSVSHDAVSERPSDDELTWQKPDTSDRHVQRTSGVCGCEGDDTSKCTQRLGDIIEKEIGKGAGEQRQGWHA